MLPERGVRQTSYLRFDPSLRLMMDEDASMRTNTDTWVIRGGVSFYVGHRKKEYWVHVPKGYVITGADIPKYFQSWIKPTTDEGKAAVIHNYLCQTGRVRRNGVPVIVPRSEANRIFLQAMKVAKVSWFKRWIIYFVAMLSKGRLKPDSKHPELFE